MYGIGFADPVLKNYASTASTTSVTTTALLPFGRPTLISIPRDTLSACAANLAWRALVGFDGRPLSTEPPAATLAARAASFA